MPIDLEEQYDKIYRYCYFRLHHRDLAEDITQETFLRYLEHYHCVTAVAALKCLYTIARNLCVDEYRRPKAEPLDEYGKPKTKPLDESIQDSDMEEKWITNLTVRAALEQLSYGEQELLLLRYVNEVPVAVIGELFGISRFSVYRRITAASNRFREELKKGGFP